MFKKIMITYKKSEVRLNNYNNMKKTIKDLECFSAYDSINFFSVCKLENKKYKLCCDTYVEKSETTLKGKLGCNMSHLSVLKNFITDNDYEWLLILEDDVTINNYNDNMIKLLIEKAQLYQSNFVKLYVNPRFIKDQIINNRKEANIYQMVSQWHANAYLINKAGANYIISKTPVDDHIDLFYSKHIKELNALAFINNIFQNQGTMNSYDKNSDYGSLILDIKPTIK
jgi:GR25 family glycosyltransferase involved in LPS biosynthesis